MSRAASLMSRTMRRAGMLGGPRERAVVPPEVAQDVALTEALKTVDRKRRMMWDLVVEIELAEPPVGKVQPDFLAQTAFVSDAVAAPDNQHPDHELWIDRWTADLAVKRP